MLDSALIKAEMCACTFHPLAHLVVADILVTLILKEEEEENLEAWFIFTLVWKLEL